ncbi:hypothetical protein ACH4VM_38710 [Streptomyces sp. NPDC020792]|uniref:hypothetical protein n=1 Tax=Streptomyces sp. NPDC020792 TaxID=3365089 RepID=UPI00378F01FD
MFFALFSRRAPTARLRQVAIARGALSVRHRARGQVENDGQRVPHSSQPDHLLSEVIRLPINGRVCPVNGVSEVVSLDLS